MPSRMVGVSASVDLPLHHKVQKFSSGTSSPGWSRKKGCKTVAVVRLRDQGYGLQGHALIHEDNEIDGQVGSDIWVPHGQRHGCR